MYQSYDRNKLVQQVWELLEEAGLTPTRQSDPRPEYAASLLLRSLGVEAHVDHVEALKRSMDTSWEESDEARAARHDPR